MINSIVKKCSWLNKDAGILVLRIGVGAIFIMSGWMKLSMLASTVAMFGQMGFSPFWAYVATFGELIGGIFVLLGIYTRLGALILATTMTVAISLTYKDMTMVMTPVAFLISNLALIFTGSGRFSLMRKICGCGTCMLCKDSDVVASPTAPTHTTPPTQA